MTVHVDSPEEAPPDQAAATSGIVVDRVTKRYGLRRALDSVSLEVRPGSVLALLGPNGAGKTTLVRVLTTLIKPDGGRASVAGFDVVADAGAVRRSVGLVGQHTAVDEYLSGRENLWLVARLLRMSRTHARTRTDAALESFGLADVADAVVGTYSGGLRRRLDIAVTLLAEPAVLFLDEPTTGLDPAGRRDVWALVERLISEGTAILLTTQYLEEADALADQVAVIDQGRLVATGTPAQLKSGLGGDTLHIRLADPARMTDAVEALGAMPLTTLVDTDHDGLTLRGPDGPTLLPDALRRLDSHGIAVTAAEVQRPGLDDVFLALTGHEAALPEETSSIPDDDHASGHRRRAHGHTRRTHR